MSVQCSKAEFGMCLADDALILLSNRVSNLQDFLTDTVCLLRETVTDLFLVCLTRLRIDILFRCGPAWRVEHR
ncbi:hypothetical protein C463_04194 [Halorubrum californiense DSM 19288]|uniref:Uncharacterized protein n=1 Tax=Halorubrum californiense DSM 19288 TaxID=1227465 RepID=M0EF20_9EURY|nr:hypothetical protein C463_04194 [Halorubrum californiense DSM 19288]